MIYTGPFMTYHYSPIIYICISVLDSQFDSFGVDYDITYLFYDEGIRSVRVQLPNPVFLIPVGPTLSLVLTVGPVLWLMWRVWCNQRNFLQTANCITGGEGPTMDLLRRACVPPSVGHRAILAPSCPFLLVPLPMCRVYRLFYKFRHAQLHFCSLQFCVLIRQWA